MTETLPDMYSYLEYYLRNILKTMWGKENAESPELISHWLTEIAPILNKICSVCY